MSLWKFRIGRASLEEMGVAGTSREVEENVSSRRGKVKRRPAGTHRRLKSAAGTKSVDEANGIDSQFAGLTV